MVLDLLTISAGLPTTIGTAEAVHTQHILDDEAESDERQAPFYLDIYCDAKSKKRDEVHGTIVVLKDSKLRLWPKDADTQRPRSGPEGEEPPHPFEGFYYPFPDEDLPDRSIPSTPILGLVSTIPPESSSSAKSESQQAKPKLNWIYIDKNTRELKYGPRKEAKEHLVGAWDWTEDDEQGLTFEGEESLVAVEEERGGYGWAIYWDRDDNGLKELDIGKNKRVLRCSLERRLVDEDEDESEEADDDDEDYETDSTI